MTIKDIRFNNIGLKLLLAFMALCPIFYDTANNLGRQTLRIGQEQFFQLGATVLFAVVIVENLYLALFLLWAVVLYAYFNFPPIGGNYVMNIFWGCVFYQLAYRLVDEKNLRQVFNLVLWVCVANLFWLALQFSSYELIFIEYGRSYNYDHVGMLGLKAFMGCFFALAVPFVMYVNRWLAWTFFVPIYLSDCSVAMVAGVTGVLFSLWYRSKKAFLVLLAVLSIAGSLYVARDTKNNMFTDRFSLWKATLQDAFKHPVMGWGLDSFRNIGSYKPFFYFKNVRTNETRAVSVQAYRVYQETGKFPPMPGFIQDGDTLDPWDNPHNEFVGLFFEFGAVGVVIFLSLVKDIRDRFRARPELIALAGFFIALLIISTGQFPLHIARLGYLVPIFLGIYYKITDNQKGVLQHG